MYRDLAQLAGVDERHERYESSSMGRGVRVEVYQALNRIDTAIQSSLAAHRLTQKQSFNLMLTVSNIKYYHENIDSLEKFFIGLMEGKVFPLAGKEDFMQAILDMLHKNYTSFPHFVQDFYIQVCYGDPSAPRSIPTDLAHIYWREQLESTMYDKYKNISIQTLYKHGEEGLYRQEVKDPTWVMTRAEENAQKLIADYRTACKNGQIISNDGPIGFLRKGSVVPYCLPSLPSVPIKLGEIPNVIAICKKEIRAHMLPGKNLFSDIDEVIELCHLLQHPDNHIKVASGQYVQRQVPSRTVIDMTNEMVQELISLPRFTAYAKLIAGQTTVKQKIQTYSLSSSPLYTPTGDALPRYCRLRSQIEQEIRERQTRWQRPPEPPPSSPPPRPRHLRLVTVPPPPPRKPPPRHG